MTLPPGIICLLYKQRWDIEKIYDEYKNKLDEEKSWGSGYNSKTANALFLCLTHNLLLILEETLRYEGVENWAESERKEGRLREALENGGNFVSTFIQRFTVRSVKFIRWLRNFCYREALWAQAKAKLIKHYAEI